MLTLHGICDTFFYTKYLRESNLELCFQTVWCLATQSFHVCSHKDSFNLHIFFAMATIYYCHKIRNFKYLSYKNIRLKLLRIEYPQRTLHSIEFCTATRISHLEHGIHSISFLFRHLHSIFVSLFSNIRNISFYSTLHDTASQLLFMWFAIILHLYLAMAREKSPFWIFQVFYHFRSIISI